MASVLGIATKVASAVGSFYTELNPATLSGAIDVIVVRQPDGALVCSPFHVRFGKIKLLQPQDKVVTVTVNDQVTDLPMKVGEAGEAFFVVEVRAPAGFLAAELATSPLHRPTSPTSTLLSLAEASPAPFRLEAADVSSLPDKTTQANTKNITSSTPDSPERSPTFQESISNNKTNDIQTIYTPDAAGGGAEKTSVAIASKQHPQASLIGESTNDTQQQINKSPINDSSSESEPPRTPKRQQTRLPRDAADVAQLFVQDANFVGMNQSASFAPDSKLSQTIARIRHQDVVVAAAAAAGSPTSNALEPDLSTIADVVAAAVAARGGEISDPELKSPSVTVDDINTERPDDYFCHARESSTPLGTTPFRVPPNYHPPLVEDNYTQRADEALAIATSRTPDVSSTTSNSYFGVVQGTDPLTKFTSLMENLSKLAVKSKWILDSDATEWIEVAKVDVIDFQKLLQQDNTTEQALKMFESARTMQEPEALRTFLKESFAEMDNHSPREVLASRKAGSLVARIDGTYYLVDTVLFALYYGPSGFSTKPTIDGPALLEIEQNLYNTILAAKIASSSPPKLFPTDKQQEQLNGPPSSNPPKVSRFSNLRSWSSSWWNRSNAMSSATNLFNTKSSKSSASRTGNTSADVTAPATSSSPRAPSSATSDSPITPQLPLTTDNDFVQEYGVGSNDRTNRATPQVTYAKSLRLTSNQLRKLNLRPGANSVKFDVVNAGFQGTATCHANIFLYDHDAKLVISDIDGTITKSDALGHLFTMVGKDWTHPGIAQLFTNIRSNGYHIMYLTSRAIGQSTVTRDYLSKIQQDKYTLPVGPVIMSPDRLFASFHREVIQRRPEEFKMACLRDIRRLFMVEGNKSPFWAGFGNRITDGLSYRSVNVPISRIFTIDPQGEIKLELLIGYKSSYVKLNDLYNQIFPPILDPCCGAAGFGTFTGVNAIADFSYNANDDRLNGDDEEHDTNIGDQHVGAENINLLSSRRASESMKFDDGEQNDTSELVDNAEQRLSTQSLEQCDAVASTSRGTTVKQVGAKLDDSTNDSSSILAEDTSLDISISKQTDYSLLEEQRKKKYLQKRKEEQRRQAEALARRSAAISANASVDLEYNDWNFWKTDVSSLLLDEELDEVIKGTDTKNILPASLTDRSAMDLSMHAAGGSAKRSASHHTRGASDAALGRDSGSSTDSKRPQLSQLSANIRAGFSNATLPPQASSTRVSPGIQPATGSPTTISLGSRTSGAGNVFAGGSSPSVASAGSTTLTPAASQTQISGGTHATRGAFASRSLSSSASSTSSTTAITTTVRGDEVAPTAAQIVLVDREGNVADMDGRTADNNLAIVVDGGGSSSSGRMRTMTRETLITNNDGPTSTGAVTSGLSGGSVNDVRDSVADAGAATARLVLGGTAALAGAAASVATDAASAVVHLVDGEDDGDGGGDDTEDDDDDAADADAELGDIEEMERSARGH